MLRVQAFIPDWPGEKQHAAKLAEIVAPFCRTVTVLDDPNAYMSEQWEAARSKFDGDVLWWIMADVWPPKRLKEMIIEMDRFLTWTVGIYSPRLRWCGWQYEMQRLLKFEVGVCEVPIAEMLCTFVKKAVVERMPHFDPKINKFGWGIDMAMTAAAWQIGQDAVWDYHFTALHPRQTDYDGEKASLQLAAWLKSLPEADQFAINAVKKAARFIAMNGAEVAKKAEFVPTAAELDEIQQFWSK